MPGVWGSWPPALGATGRRTVLCFRSVLRPPQRTGCPKPLATRAALVDSVGRPARGRLIRTDAFPLASLTRGVDAIARLAGARAWAKGKPLVLGDGAEFLKSWEAAKKAQ